MLADLAPLFNTLSVQPHVLSVQAMRVSTSVNGDTLHSLNATLRLDAPMIDDGGYAKRTAQLMAKADPATASVDTVGVVLVYGYDMGIASGWKKHAYSFKSGFGK